MWVQSLGWEDSLEKEMATHSNILIWEIPWTEESGRLSGAMESQRVRHDLAMKQQQQSVIYPSECSLHTWKECVFVCLF